MLRQILPVVTIPLTLDDKKDYRGGPKTEARVTRSARMQQQEDRATAVLPSETWKPLDPEIRSLKYRKPIFECGCHELTTKFIIKVF